jgi:predicted GNAT family acetyltransferase
MSANVTESTQRHRFELPIANGVIAAAYYRVDDRRIVLIHTEVPSEFSGQGIASRLALGTFELLRKTGRKAILKCPVISWFFIKHPEYADIVAG